MPPMKRPGDHVRVVEREHRVDARVDEPAGVLVEQDQRGQAGRADRVALRDRLRGVADRVERIGHPAHRLGHVRHLGDAAGVVGDRPERVEGDDQAAHRELGHHGDADPVDVAAGDLVGGDDAARDHDHRQSAVASMPFARPAMMFVAWPVVDASAIFLTGLQRLPV